MSSFMANASNVERKWYVIDAAGKPVGRVATLAATLLRGKHKPTFTPHVDCGDHVIIINCDKAVFTGKKALQKIYYRHSGWVGGLKETTAGEMMKNRSDRAMFLAVKGMVPDTTIGRNALTRLRTYKTDEHKHQAQKPEVWNGEIR
ncbi:MAG: 50S ribosomal protein L13 [Clostridia bacterium]|nr:50S ribosomal protein L13 [Clostridia bacterium]